jgi:hypothetical protein
MRFYLYRPESMMMRAGHEANLFRCVDWEADGDLAALINLAVRLLGGDKRPTVYSMPVLEPTPGGTQCRRAYLLRAGAPTAILSPVRLYAFRKFLAFTISLRPTAAKGEDDGVFAERVARQARDVEAKFSHATYEPVD